MSQTIRAGIIGAGWPGGQHAKGYTEAGGFKIVAVADLIPARRERMMSDIAIVRRNRREAPVVQRAWIVLARVDLIVLDGAGVPEQAHIKDVGGLAVDERRQLADGAVFEFE